MGLIKLTSVSKSELECLDLCHLLLTLAFICTRMDVPKYLENTHEPSCSKRLTTPNDTGTSRQKGQARKAVGKAACQRNAEMLVRVYIRRGKKKGHDFQIAFGKDRKGGKNTPPNQRTFPETRATPKTCQLCCMPLSRSIWVGRWVFAGTLTGMSLCQFTPGWWTQQSTQLSTGWHKTICFTEMGNKTYSLERTPVLRQHYLSCLLGKVFRQNLGLAAGEERGLEGAVQQDRKQEKEY